MPPGIWNRDPVLEETFNTLETLKDKEVKSIIKFIVLKKLSNKWPYDMVKSKLDSVDKFKKYFDKNIDLFSQIYTEWKDYAERTVSN